MPTEHGNALPEALSPAFAALLQKEVQRLTPMVTELYQSALIVFGSETEAQKELIFTLLKEFTRKACEENPDMPPAQPIAFAVQLVVQLIKAVCGAEIITVAMHS